MDLEIRPITEDEIERFVRAVESAFHAVPTEDEVRIERDVLEPDRTLAVFDGHDIVGSTAAYSLQLTIPGGVAPMAGVTSVAVIPTHRRCGILTELMRRQLEDVHARGEALAGLWASEAAIYPRFGYGLATLHASFEIERSRALFGRPIPPDPGRVRMVQPDEAMAAMPGPYERIRPSTPGFLDRSAAWWNALYSDLEHHRDGGGPLLFAVHEAAGLVDGYVAYRVKRDWSEGVPATEAMVHELIAADPTAYAALWGFVFGLDVVAKISTWRRPVDEPLLHMVAEPRRLKFRISDALWLRLVDVRTALSKRSYASGGELVLDIRDAQCPWNDGAIRLVTDGTLADAETEHTAEPDVRLNVSDLAAVYLGAMTFDRLHAAGRIEAGSRDALRRADDLFRTPRAPWCPHIF